MLRAQRCVLLGAIFEPAKNKAVLQHRMRVKDRGLDHRRCTLSSCGPCRGQRMLFDGERVALDERRCFQRY
jgi:hypothetical protein